MNEGIAPTINSNSKSNKHYHLLVVLSTKDYYRVSKKGFWEQLLNGEEFIDCCDVKTLENITINKQHIVAIVEQETR